MERDRAPRRTGAGATAVIASLLLLLTLLAAPAGAQSDDTTPDAEPAEGELGVEAPEPTSDDTPSVQLEGAGEGLELTLDDTAAGGDLDSSAACTGNGRTVSGTVSGTNGNRVRASLGISYLDSNGNALNDGNGGYWGDNEEVGLGIGPEGEAGSPLTFSFSNVPSNACSFWIEVYPRSPSGQTDRTYYGGGLIRNRPLTSGGSSNNHIYLPRTCGVGGGTASDPSHTTTGDVTVRAYVNGTPRGINRLSYWSRSTPVNPVGRAYGFGVESPAAPFPAVLDVPSMAANQAYNVRVQIPSTGNSNLAYMVPSVSVHPCETTHLHVVFGTPFGTIWSIGRFRDVPTSNPFSDEIEWMADEEITTGYSDGTYRPISIVTRQAMSAFMYRLAGEPAFTAPGTPTFSDVGASNPFYDEIEWMADEGISTGYEDSTYRPSWQVTRGAMSAFMYRLADEPPFTPPTASSFSDVALDFAFFNEIEWMNDEEITTGYADGTYRPGAGVSRQAMSAFMFRLDPLLS